MNAMEELAFRQAQQIERSANQARILMLETQAQNLRSEVEKLRRENIQDKIFLARWLINYSALFRLVGELNAKCNQTPEEAEKRAIELRNENMSKLFLPNNREFMPDMGLANINPHLFLRNEVYNHFTKE